MRVTVIAMYMPLGVTTAQMQRDEVSHAPSPGSACRAHRLHSDNGNIEHIPGELCDDLMEY